MVYAKIRNPEYFDWGCYESEIEESKAIIAGNDRLCGLNDRVIKQADKLCDDMICDMEYDACSYDKDDGSEFIDDEFAILKAIATSSKLSTSETYEEFRLKYLKMYFGKEYSCHRIKGCSQGDWNNLYCPSDCSKEFIDYVEALYFNTGSEIEVHDGEDDVNDANDIHGYCFYTSEWDVDRIKSEIAKQEGVGSEEVVLFKFDGYVKIERYERI